MKLINNLIGGFAGALALNILHQTIAQFDHDAPRVDLVGEEALTSIVEATGNEAPTGNNLFATTLGADLLSNSLYYSLIGMGKKKNLLLRGATVGLTAGLGALTLTKPMGLSDAPITKANRTKLMTVGYYLAGGLIAAGVMKSLSKQ